MSDPYRAQLIVLGGVLLALFGGALLGSRILKGAEQDPDGAQDPDAACSCPDHAPTLHRERPERGWPGQADVIPLRRWGSGNRDDAA